MSPSTDHDTVTRPTFAGHVSIARIDHWFKNIFVIPGIVVAIGYDPEVRLESLWLNLCAGLLATCLIASSNYTINEVLDAPFDRLHPRKRTRPVPSGKVSTAFAYVQWIALMALGLGLAATVSTALAATLGVLWIMGGVYNIPPVRSKDVPYVDVLTEAVNNPLRMLAGWYMAGGQSIPPASLLLSYWMVGCYFMAIKRYSELKELGSREKAAAYRASLARVSPDQMLVATMFYAAASMLFLGAFAMRYRVELILSFPFIALVMARYLHLGFIPNSPAQKPEQLYKDRTLMAAVAAAGGVSALLLAIDLPWLQSLVAPTVPVQSPAAPTR